MDKPRDFLDLLPNDVLAGSSVLRSFLFSKHPDVDEMRKSYQSDSLVHVP